MFEALFKYSRADYLRSELIYSGQWPAWLLIGLALLAVVFILALLYHRRGTGRWYQLAAVGALQLSMLALVIWVLRQPTLTTERLRDGENAVALVVDASASMAHGPAPESSSNSRFQTAVRSLANAITNEDAPDLEVRHYELGRSATAVPSFVDSLPVESETSIANGLATILAEARFSPLAAVVLSSDGADTDGGLTAEEIAEIAAYGVPIHTIGVGRTAMPEDVELTDVTVPDKALPGSTVSARLTIQHDAAADAQVKVYDGDNLLQILPVELRADAGTTTTWVEVELADAGPHQLEFSVDALENETELRNNIHSTLINVANQRYRVLYFEGEPRWEYKFLRRAVNNDEDLAIATLLRVSPNKFYRQGIESAEQLQDGFPATRDELFGYNAVIIGSVEAAFLSTEQQEILRDFVSTRGGSLLMLAGPNGLGNGGWGQSALADVLPAQLPPTTSDSFRRRKVSVSLTPQGVVSQILRFDADQKANLDAWLELPEVADYQVVGNLKPATVTLLNAETEVGQVPLLITHPFGRGHAWILASGGTWRWQMSMPLEDQKHETFWRQVLRGLVASTPDNVSLSAEAGSGDGTIFLRAEFRDDAFEPVDDIGVTVVASHASEASFSHNMQPHSEEAGVFVSELTPPQAGTWYFEAVAERNGEPIAVSRSSLLYESGQSEHFGFRRNSGLLQRLSESTGGRYFGSDDLSGLSDLLRYSSAGITETEYRSVWDAPAIFILLVLLKASEWLLRRRWQTI